jgi:Transposase IS116/IS110/IS902 family
MSPYQKRHQHLTPDNPFDTKAGRVVVGLLAEGWTPARIAATPRAELRTLFGGRGCRLSGPLAGRLIGRAATALPAHPAATVGKAATLAAMLGALAALDRQIAGLEAEMAPLLARTQGAKLLQVRGVGTVAAAGFVAFVGHTGRWTEWSKVWRAAGLDPARSQSGATDASYGISREGSAWGRRAILDVAASVCRQPGRWQDGYRARTLSGRKHPKVALAAAGNQVGRTLFALMASGADYDPNHETKRAERRSATQPKAGGQAA